MPRELLAGAKREPALKKSERRALAPRRRRTRRRGARAAGRAGLGCGRAGCMGSGRVCATEALADGITPAEIESFIVKVIEVMDGIDKVVS